MITKELAYIIMFAGGATLFAIGGMGFKWSRRYILPMLMAIVASFLEVSIFKIILAVILSSVAFHLPYGDKTPIILKIFTALSMGLCLLPLRLNPIVAIIPVVFLLGMWLSNKFNWFTWKWTELLTGATWGVVAVLLM